MATKTEFIQQGHYLEIEIDYRESDIIQLWQNGEVLQIEREKTDELITKLKEL